MSLSNHRNVYRSPSYYRRQARRRNDRLTQNMCVSTPVVKMPVAEQAKEELTEQSNVVNKCNENTILETTVKVDEHTVLEKEREKKVEVYDAAEEVDAGREAKKVQNNEFCRGKGVQKVHINDANKSADPVEDVKEDVTLEDQNLQRFVDMRNLEGTGQHVGPQMLHYPMPRLELWKF